MGYSHARGPLSHTFSPTETSLTTSKYHSRYIHEVDTGNPAIGLSRSPEYCNKVLIIAYLILRYKIFRLRAPCSTCQMYLGK